VFIAGGGVKGVAEDELYDAGDLLPELWAVRVHEKVRAGEGFANVLAELFLELGFVALDKFLGNSFDPRGSPFALEAAILLARRSKRLAFEE